MAGALTQLFTLPESAVWLVRGSALLLPLLLSISSSVFRSSSGKGMLPFGLAVFLSTQPGLMEVFNCPATLPCFSVCVFFLCFSCVVFFCLLVFCFCFYLLLQQYYYLLYCTVYVLYCIVLYCIIFHCTVLYCFVLYCTVLYCIVLYCTVFTVLYCIVLYCIVLYCTVLYCTVLYCIKLYCNVLMYCIKVYCTVKKKKFMRLRKLCDFVVFTKKIFLLNNIYANQIPGQSTCVKSFIFASSYLCTLTTTRIIRINNITAGFTLIIIIYDISVSNVLLPSVNDSHFLIWIL